MKHGHVVNFSRHVLTRVSERMEGGGEGEGAETRPQVTVSPRQRETAREKVETKARVATL